MLNDMNTPEEMKAKHDELSRLSSLVFEHFPGDMHCLHAPVYRNYVTIGCRAFFEEERALMDLRVQAIRRARSDDPAQAFDLLTDALTMRPYEESLWNELEALEFALDPGACESLRRERRCIYAGKMDSPRLSRIFGLIHCRETDTLVVTSNFTNTVWEYSFSDDRWSMPDHEFSYPSGCMEIPGRGYCVGDGTDLVFVNNDGSVDTAPLRERIDELFRTDHLLINFGAVTGNHMYVLLCLNQKTQFVRIDMDDPTATAEVVDSLACHDILTRLCVMDGVVYVGDRLGRIRTWDPESGETRLFNKGLPAGYVSCMVPGPGGLFASIGKQLVKYDRQGNLLYAVDFPDMLDTPKTTPIYAALRAGADGESRLYCADKVAHCIHLFKF